MKFSNVCRGLSSLTVQIVGAFCFLFLIFLGAYVYVDYRSYLSSYQITQQSELKSLRDKISLNVDNIKKLSVLTSKRIAASKGDVKRIQSILVSTPSLLPDKDFLKLQKVTYEKFSHPQCLVTRLGVSSPGSDKRSLEATNKKEPSFFFEQNSVYSKTGIFSQDGVAEGILEIHIDTAHFKEMLKIGSTLSFVHGADHVLLQKSPLPIYGKLPQSFWGYYAQSVGHYMIFFLFAAFTVVFIVLSTIYSRIHIRQEIGQEIETLKDAVSKWQMESHKANDALITNQKRAETHQTTCQSYTQFQTSFFQHQREQLNHVLRSIDVVMRSFQNPNVSLPGQELMDILKSCLNVVESIVSGSLTVSRRVPVRLIKTLSSVRSVFTEKMHISELTMEMHCSEDLTYYGDPMMIEFILLNLIGKSLYLAPKKGKVEIRASGPKEGLHVQVKNKGFSTNEKMQKQIMQAFDFFMADDHFHQFCQENGFYYEYNKDKDGLNMATLFFPNVEIESLGDNVISLFNKR